MVLLWNAWHLDVCELFETYICFSFSYFNGLTAGNETKMPIRVYQTYTYVNCKVSLLKNMISCFQIAIDDMPVQERAILCNGKQN